VRIRKERKVAVGRKEGIAMRIDRSEFGSITIDGKTYDRMRATRFKG